MKAFLLAAGKGTRLRPLTEKTPKCLMPIGGKPLLEIWIRLLERHGITDVLINTHHLAHKVETFVKAFQRTVNINITTVYENKLLGSGGTVWANRDFVSDENDFLIAYSDNLTNINLSGMMRHHRRYLKKGGIFTMGVFHSPRPGECGIVELEKDQKIITFTEKPEKPASDLANGGIYMASRAVFDYFPGSGPMNDGVLDFGHHVLPQLTGHMYGYIIQEYLRDIGTIESYQTALKEWPLKEATL